MKVCLSFHTQTNVMMVSAEYFSLLFHCFILKYKVGFRQDFSHVSSFAGEMHLVCIVYRYVYRCVCVSVCMLCFSGDWTSGAGGHCKRKVDSL